MKAIGSVDSLKIVALINNSPKYDTLFKGCFGISFWVQVAAGDMQKNILFDVGPIAEPLLYNAGKMNLKLSDVDMIVLSHGHFDHTEALADILPAIDHEVPIIGHPDIFKPRFVLEPEFMNYGMVTKNRRENIERLGGYFILSKSPLQLFPGLLFSGEVARTTEFEETGGVLSYTTDGDGNLIPDQIQDDASLVINVQDKGIIVLTGCAHAGPVNILKHSIKVSGIDRVEGIMGGFHLLEAGQERVDLTIREFHKYNPNWVAPMHCTGLVPSAKIAMSFGDKYREVNAGDVVRYRQMDHSFDSRKASLEFGRGHSPCGH